MSVPVENPSHPLFRLSHPASRIAYNIRDSPIEGTGAMRLPPKLIEIIAFRVVQRLVETGAIVCRDPNVRDQLEAAIERALTEEFKLEDQLDEEVRRILAQYADQIDRSQVEYHELFRKIKQRLAKERGIVL